MGGMRIILVVCYLVLAGWARGQTVLGKHPADKMLDGFWNQNTNANQAVLGISKYATVPLSNNTLSVTVSNLTARGDTELPLTGGHTVRLRRGDTGGVDYQLMSFSDHLRLTNSPFLQWVDFEDGIALGDGLNDERIVLRVGTRTVATSNFAGGTFHGSGAGLSNVPAASIVGGVGIATNTGSGTNNLFINMRANKISSTNSGGTTTNYIDLSLAQMFIWDFVAQDFKPTVDWGSQALLDTPNGGTESVNWHNRSLTGQDGLTVLLDWNDPAALIDKGGDVKVEWGLPGQMNIGGSTGTTNLSYGHSAAVSLFLGKALYLGTNVQTTNFTLGNSNTMVSVRGTNVFLKDGRGSNAVVIGDNVSGRRLVNGQNITVVDWESLICADAANTISVDWANRQLSDGSQTSVDWANRQLNDATGTAAVDYQGKQLVGNWLVTGSFSAAAGVNGVVPTNATTLLLSGGGLAALVVSNDNRRVGLGATNYIEFRNTNTAAVPPDLNVHTNGNVYVRRGVVGNILGGDGQTAFYADSRIIGDTAGGLSLDGLNRVLYDSVANPRLNWEDGELTDNWYVTGTFQSIGNLTASGNRISNAGHYQQATNALSSWPTAAATPGGCAWVNSNATVYILTSTPGGTAWTKTNPIAGPNL